MKSKPYVRQQSLFEKPHERHSNEMPVEITTEPKSMNDAIDSVLKKNESSGDYISKKDARTSKATIKEYVPRYCTCDKGRKDLIYCTACGLKINEQ